MAIQSGRQIVITQTAPFVATWTFTAANNANAPADVQIYTLATTNNTINFPTGGAVVAGITIVPPAGNSASITLKGSSGDTGIAIHKTDPTSIAFDTTNTTQTSIVLTVSTTVTGLYIIWT